MKKIYSSKDMKAVDDYSINTLKIPSLALMERAAAYVAEEIDKYHDKHDKILVVCGVGNNGADGLCTLRILHSLGYLNLMALEVGETDKATKEYNIQKEILNNMGIPIYSYFEDKHNISFDAYDVIVDAIFGIGLTRMVEGLYEQAIQNINNAPAKIYSIDIPSGVDGDTGLIHNVAVKAHKTITFGANKIGNVLCSGSEYAGEVVVCNIGFPRAAYEELPYCQVIEKHDLCEVLPKRTPYSNKGTYGKLLIIAGNDDMYGAAYLCSRAAFAMGVGVVKIITSKKNKDMINDKLPEAIVISYSDKNDEELQKIVLDELKWCDTILIGPGLGTSAKAVKLVGMSIGSLKKLIIDADGINILAKNPALKEKLHNNVIITPHLGEAERLCNMSIKDIKQDMIGVCQSLVDKFKVSCVLKDARSVIINSLGEKYINTTGNSGMSKAGSGDVLAGIIAGLVTTGMDINLAAAYGSFIHGTAGDVAKEENGEYGMLPTDMIKAIKQALYI